MTVNLGRTRRWAGRGGAVERAIAALEKRGAKKPTNACEHGDHPAPEGKRFCSDACKACEAAGQSDGRGCAKLCATTAESAVAEEGAKGR